jgi:hypothetical protein
MAFDFKGAINTTWTLVLILLTLPWSLVSIIFAWALIQTSNTQLLIPNKIVLDLNRYYVLSGVKSS